MKLLRYLAECFRILMLHIVRNLFLGSYVIGSFMCFFSAAILGKIDKGSSHVISVTMGKTRYSVSTEGSIVKEN